YNVLAVIGIVALVTPISVSPGVRGFEFPALLAFTALVVGLMYRHERVSRADGSILTGGYLLFVYLLLP
ncbi:sodium:calcium antiporter, partial [Halorubrum sp. SD626R]